MRFFIFFFCLLCSSFSFASGNHPDAGACDAERPWYAICTHSLHSLEGWYGDNCYAEREPAQKEAEAHAKKYHNGNMRWTGVKKNRDSGKY
jgi:hypothetical protein